MKRDIPNRENIPVYLRKDLLTQPLMVASNMAVDTPEGCLAHELSYLWHDRKGFYLSNDIVDFIKIAVYAIRSDSALAKYRGWDDAGKSSEKIADDLMKKIKKGFFLCSNFYRGVYN